MRIWAPLAQVTFGLVHRLCELAPALLQFMPTPPPIAAWVPGSQEELRECIRQPSSYQTGTILYMLEDTHTSTHAI